MDILLSHGFYLATDPAERQIMRPYPPLGILYLSSHLKSCGVGVGVFDATFENMDAYAQLLARHHPPIVGISANLMTRRSVVSMIALARGAGSLVVVGGPDPANYPAEYLEHGANVVVIGEGESTLQELVPHLLTSGLSGLRNIAGLAFRDETGEIVRTPARDFIKDLDGQPFPDRQAVDIARYVRTWRIHHGLGSVSLITARGCPYTCTWCSHSVFGYSHRRRSPVNVAEEVELITATWKPDMVWYADDVFTIHHRWLSDYASELKRRHLRVPFETISREDRLTEPVIRTLAEMGCLRLWLGSESGSQRVMDGMERATDVVRLRWIVHLLQRYGIEAGLFVMLGYDGEELSDLEATVEHLKICKADRVLTTIAYPIKGTPYFDRVSDRVVVTTPWAAGSDRDLSVTGRHSRRFYQYATRWMTSEVALQAERERRRPRLVRLARTFLNARLGRAGMWMTEREVERGVA